MSVRATAALIGDIGSTLMQNLTASSGDTWTTQTSTASSIDRITPSALTALKAATRSTQLAATLSNVLSDNLYGSMAGPVVSTMTSQAMLPAAAGVGGGIGGVGGTSSVSASDAADADAESGSDDLIHNEFVQIFFCLLYTTVFVLGVFGNVLVCYVVLRNRAMQTVTNIFITNLALSDILLCVLAVPFTPLYTFMRRWAFGRTLCHLVSFAQGCSIYISTLTLTSIAIDRYFVIIYPFHPRMKLSTCIAIIISIWVIALLATLPYGMYMKVISDNDTMLLSNNTLLNGTIAFNANINANVNISELRYDAFRWNHLDVDYIDSVGFVDTESASLIAGSEAAAFDSLSTTATEAYKQLLTPTTTASAAGSIYGTGAAGAAIVSKSFCEENWPSEQYRKVFGSVTTILQFVLPFIIISICYTWVSVKLNARARAKPGSKSSRREEADRDRKKRTNRMLIAMVAVFGLSWLPINVVNIFDDFYEKSNDWRFYTLFFFVAHSIAMSSTCYNPFLYAWLNENFRKEFKHVLPCFNPSNNNNILNIARGYNRSERNTCGPRLRHGSECGGPGGGGDNDRDKNGITQETTCLPKDKLLIIPREPTYGNGKNAGALSPQRFGFGCSSGGGNNGGSGGGAAASMSARHVEIILNESGCDSMRGSRSRRNNHMHRNDLDEIDSGDEQTIEMRFCETPFVSSDNTTAISMLETSTNNDAERSGTSSSVTDGGGEGFRSSQCN